MFPFHSYAFQEGLIHAENIGGDIEKMLNQRAVIGAFPWRYEGLEACPCRIVCFQGMDEAVEARGGHSNAALGFRRLAPGPNQGGPDGRPNFPPQTPARVWRVQLLFGF